MIIVGYSGHSYGIIECAIGCGIEISGYNDLEEKKFNPYHLKFITDSELISKKAKIFIAIGDNLRRREVFFKHRSQSQFEIKLIHKTAVVSSSASIENQVFISMGCVINAHSKIGFGSVINSGSIIEHQTQIGTFSHVAPGSTLCGNVIIGDNTLIGAGTVVLPNIKIGNNVIVGAGSIVLKDIPDNTVFIKKVHK